MNNPLSKDNKSVCGVMVHTRGTALGFKSDEPVYCAEPQPCKFHSVASDKKSERHWCSGKGCCGSTGPLEEAKQNCFCACHQNVLQRPYEHDSPCCKNMNGMVVKEAKQMVENQCDGCKAGMPLLKTGGGTYHTKNGKVNMYCTKERYSQPIEQKECKGCKKNGKREGCYTCGVENSAEKCAECQFEEGDHSQGCSMYKEALVPEQKCMKLHCKCMKLKPCGNHHYSDCEPWGTHTVPPEEVNSLIGTENTNCKLCGLKGMHNKEHKCDLKGSRRRIEYMKAEEEKDHIPDASIMIPDMYCPKCKSQYTGIGDGICPQCETEMQLLESTVEQKECNAEKTGVKCRPPCELCYGGRIISPSKSSDWEESLSEIFTTNRNAHIGSPENQGRLHKISKAAYDDLNNFIRQEKEKSYQEGVAYVMNNKEDLNLVWLAIEDYKRKILEKVKRLKAQTKDAMYQHAFSDIDSIIKSGE